jgi:hypothetical protein
MGRLLGALAIALAGCGNPPPPCTSHTPLIERGDPAFGAIVEPADLPFRLGVVASSLCKDTLYARLYWRNGPQSLRLADDVVVQSGAAYFSTIRYCALVGRGPRRFDVYVLDGAFGSPELQPDELPAGRYASGGWDVTCQ